MVSRIMLQVLDFKRISISASYLNLFIISVLFKLVISTQRFQSLIQNPGKEVNFYGKIPSNLLSSDVKAEKTFDELVHQSCSKSSNESSCLKRLLNHYPGILCEIQNPISCNYSYPYRKIDGTCNNPHISRLGMANQCFERFIPAYYEGDGGFRKSVKGGPLPEVRDITLKIFKDHHKPTTNVTFQFATFGEFLAIDILLSVSPPIDCCSEKNENNPHCAPISVRPDDPFYSKFNQTCVDFVRTEQCDCNTPKRAQKNGVTSAIDVSQIYGTSEDRSMELRTLDGTGQLKHDNSSVGCLLPSGKGPGDLFCPKGDAPKCFQSGDPRTNHHTTVTSLLTIFMREHNRIATALKQMNPGWGEEKLFQEARKILIAEFQCIVFKDFLPILLSPRIVEDFNLTVPDGSKGIRYDPSVILGMWNEFGAASYRLHSMVPRNIGPLNLRFKDTFSNPYLIREGRLSQLIKGAHQVPSEQYDRYMIHDLSDFLYQQPGVPYGKDLASTNILRGRDHGLAPYIEILKFCSEGKIIVSSFDDLHKFGLISTDNVDLLKQVYAAVEDIDMWVGMQLEDHMPGAITGPSAVCINAKQFYFNQKGDRFYFDLEGPEAPFTANQRSALKKCSLARILCDDADMSTVTKNPFLLRSDENSALPCSEIPQIDLMLWKDNGETAVIS